ncbi:hypothetical protein QF041_002606 [Paenibacillus sp. W2I17]|nr:hypothetical protein [Paenibacillus sp. W2I17]
MNDDTTTEETITITKGSTHSLHIRCPYKPAYEPKQKMWIIP